MEEKIHQFQELLQNDTMKGSRYSIDFLELNVMQNQQISFEAFSSEYEAAFKTSFFKAVRKLDMEQYFAMCKMLRKYIELTSDR
ncbi:MAG TPA: hypothetical protein DDY13_02420 [Cytophagales bacterium]|jgi:hypothetical protein|nr:hypothetical protein [Cytophagales bacterium]